MAAKRRLHLTDAVVRKLAAPDTGYTLTYDDDEAASGFAVRTMKSGTKAFVLNYFVRGLDRSYTLGKFPVLSTVAARVLARKLRRKIADGADPLADREAERNEATVHDLIARFQSEWLPRRRPSTKRDYEGMIRVWLKPHFSKQLKVADVTFSDISRLHRKITESGSPYRANRVVAVCSRMFTLATRWGMCESNPCRGIEKNVEHHRRRYLSHDELVRLVAAIAQHPDRASANAIKVLALTGARRGEVLSMAWENLDLTAGTWSKPPSSVKQNSHHQVPISGPVRAILSAIREQQQPKSDWVFPSTGEKTPHLTEVRKSWRAICRTAAIENLRLHDLRHSFASALISSGSSLPLVGSLLGHSQPATTARYSHMFQDPMRAAVERIGSLIENAAAQVPANVVPLKSRP